MGTWNDEDTNRLFESGEKLLQSLTNEMNGYNYNTTGGTDMEKVKLQASEVAIVKRAIDSASMEYSVMQSAVAFLVRDVGYSLGDEEFTRLLDAILHGYREVKFKLRLSGVRTYERYVHIARDGEITIKSSGGATRLNQRDLDHNMELERLADGCIKEYEA